MRKGLSWLASVVLAAVSCAAACTTLPPGQPAPVPLPIPGSASTEALRHLGADLAEAAPGAKVVAAVSRPNACGQHNDLVIRGIFPERILFAMASDQPAEDAAEALNALADRVRRDAPEAELTILGHTDFVGSDAYNIDLSRRRALSVMLALVRAGLDPNHLSAVAIGKRQPIADNGTAEGRGRNRRVEFLISGCLAANLDVVWAQATIALDAGTPADVMRLGNSPEPALATIDTVSLQRPADSQSLPATVAPASLARPPAVQPSASMATPAPAPHY